MLGLGTGEIVVLGFIVVLLFGTNKLPKLGSSLGEGIRNFKKGLNGQDQTEEAKKIDTK